MKICRLWLLIALAGISCGCVASRTVTGVPMDVVINELKERLKAVGPVAVTYHADAGCTKTGDYAIVAFPTKIQVQLKTVLTDTNTAGVGGQFGTPIVVTPTAQRAASSIKTSQTTANFCAIPEKLRDLTDGKPPNADCVWSLHDPNADYVSTLWPTQVKSISLDEANEKKHERIVTVKAGDQPPVTDLADALDAAIVGLVYSQHVSACLLPQSIDVQLAFEASVDTTAGFKLALVFVNIQDSQEFKRDYTNTMTVTFNLSKGSTATLMNAVQ
jgi:hypothetical protein